MRYMTFVKMREDVGNPPEALVEAMGQWMGQWMAGASPTGRWSTRAAFQRDERRGTRIAYDRRGEGPALVLVDGAMGNRA